MATTPTHAIVYPVVGNTITPLATHFANLANSTDTALTAVSNGQDGYVGTDAVRIAMIAPRLREGISYYSTDTDKEWFYNGTTWVSSGVGSNLVWPTSATTATIGANAVVTASSAASFSLNGVFNSRFREYEVSYDLTRSAGSANLFMRMRNVTTDATGTVYIYRRIGTSGAGYVENLTTANSAFEFSLTPVLQSVGRFRIRQAAIAAPTLIYESVSYERDGASLSQTFSMAGEHRDNSAYDGITFFTSSGTLSGNVRVIGLTT